MAVVITMHPMWACAHAALCTQASCWFAARTAATNVALAGYWCLSTVNRPVTVDADGAVYGLHLAVVHYFCLRGQKTT